MEARAGGTVQLRCRPQGSGPFNIEWLKVDGVLNPSATQTRDGLLEIRQVTAADTGRYRCLATGSSGSSDGFAIVSVIGKKHPIELYSLKDLGILSFGLGSLLR